VEDRFIRDVRADARRASLSNAHGAFFAGAFEACLAACDAIETRDARAAFDVALLRARVLLRLRRFAEAIDALRACSFTPTTPDGIVSAQMLLGTAHVWLNDVEPGLALLAQAQEHAAQVHPTIRAELTLHRGIAFHVAGRVDAADAALAAVPPDADMITARALEYRGWIAMSRRRFADGMPWFRAAFACIRSCRWRDRFVEASVISALTSLCAETLEFEDWPAIEAFVHEFDWQADGLEMPRLWTAFYCSVVNEQLGRTDEALAWSRDAETHAVDPGYRAIALDRTAAIFRGLGEPKAHLEFALRARAAYSGMQPLRPDLRLLPLSNAEELACAGAVADAEKALRAYRELGEHDKQEVRDDKRVQGLENLVGGCIAEGRGDRTEAVKLHASAFRTFRAIGYRRRAVATALRLARLTGSRRYVQYANTALAGAHPDYWMAREARALQSVDAPALTDHQRTILLLVAQGKTYKEIGSHLGRSWKTISNSVEHLRGKFRAGNRGELVARALRHGVVDVGDAESVRSA